MLLFVAVCSEQMGRYHPPLDGFMLIFFCTRKFIEELIDESVVSCAPLRRRYAY